MRPPDFVFPRARPLLATLLLVSATACAPHAAHSRPLAMGGAADPSAGLPASNAPGRSIDDTQKSKSQLDAPLQEFAKRIGVVCDTDSGKLTCIGGKPENGDYAEIELHPLCDSKGIFGIVNAKDGAELRDKVSPLDTMTNALVRKGQGVCVRAIGRAGGKPFYYYVAALPSAFFPPCGNQTGCAQPRDHSIEWKAQKQVAPCGMDEALEDCASGWAWAGDITINKVLTTQR